VYLVGPSFKIKTESKVDIVGNGTYDFVRPVDKVGALFEVYNILSSHGNLTETTFSEVCGVLSWS